MPSSLVIRMCAIEVSNEGARTFTGRGVFLLANPCRGKSPVTHGPLRLASPAWLCPAHPVYQQSEWGTKAATDGRFLKVRSKIGMWEKTGRIVKIGHRLDTRVWITA